MIEKIIGWLKILFEKKSVVEMPKPHVEPVITEVPPVVAPPLPSQPEPILVENKPIPANPLSTPAQRLHNAALLAYGKDASPNDIAPDELGCMESVDEVFKAATGKYINGTTSRVSLSTYQGLMIMRSNPAKFKRVYEYEIGCIILCATGMSKIKNTPVRNGHIGIITKNRRILSNSSTKAKWLDLFTIEGWNSYYGVKGGYDIYIYRPL